VVPSCLLLPSFVVFVWEAADQPKMLASFERGNLALLLEQLAFAGFRKAAVDSKHTELAVKGTEYSPAEPGLAVPCPAGYRTVGNTVDSTVAIAAAPTEYWTFLHFPFPRNISVNYLLVPFSVLGKSLLKLDHV